MVPATRESTDLLNESRDSSKPSFTSPPRGDYGMGSDIFSRLKTFRWLVGLHQVRRCIHFNLLMEFNDVGHSWSSEHPRRY